MSIITKLKSQVKSVHGVQKIIERRRIKKKFATEINLLNSKDISRSVQPSIIHFSLNKSATTYVKKLLNRFAADNDLVNVNMNDYAFATNMPFLDTLSKNEFQKYKHVFKTRGYLYSAFGGMVEGIEDFSEYKILFMVRDPRDILVSNYYSLAYSHPTPTLSSNKYQDFIDLRAAIRDTTIDAFVKQRWESVFHIFDRYERLLLTNEYENVHVLRYEDMVNNYEIWLRRLLEHCELSVNEKIIHELIQENESNKPKKENINAHLRKGKIGDYKNKLKPETIAFLNDKFSKGLSYFGYQVTV